MNEAGKMNGTIKMNRWLNICLCCVLFWIIFASSSSSWAGQVITKEDRLWARRVLAEEKSLGVTSAPNTLAVFSFQNNTGKQELDPLQKGLALMLITDLSQVKSIQVVERVKLQALVDEMKLGKSGLVEMNRAPRVGKLLGAQKLVSGDLQKGQVHSLQIDALFLNVQTAEILKQHKSEGELAELFNLEKNLVSDILKFLVITPTPDEEKKLQKPFTKSIKAAMDLFEGIASSDKGDYLKAARFYKRALKEDPAIGHAQEALGELQNLGLVPNAGSSGSLLHSIKEQTSLTDQLPSEDTTKRKKILPGPGGRTGQTNHPVNFPPNEFPN
jgi:TolB-like protein